VLRRVDRYMINSKSLVGLLKPEDEGATVPRTVGDCVPIDPE